MSLPTTINFQVNRPVDFTLTISDVHNRLSTVVVEDAHGATIVSGTMCWDDEDEMWNIALVSHLTQGCAIGSARDFIVNTWITDFVRSTIDWNDHPHLKGWFDEISGRPAVQRGVEVLASQRRPLVDDASREVLFGDTQYRRR